MPMSIRLARLDDAAQVQAIYAPYCFTPISFEAEPPSVDDMRGRIEKTLPDYPWLVCEDNSTIQGYVYATRHRERAAYRWSVDTAVYIHPDAHRRGLGRALYTSLLAVLPLQRFANAYAGATLPNPASVGLHQAMGFQPVGIYRQVGFKLGAWHDVAWFHRPLQASTVPSDPIPLDDVCRTSEWLEGINSGLHFCAEPRSRTDAM